MGFCQYHSHLPSEIGDDETSWPQQCGSTGRGLILWHNTLKTLWLHGAKGKGEQGKKEERTRVGRAGGKQTEQTLRQLC